MMEALFMSALERQDAAEAQMRQQSASYSQTLACELLAAGYQPPPWLLPHRRRGAAAEQQMRMQVEAYCQSRARALVDAGHLPPPWLLPHRAAAAARGLLPGQFERPVPADVRMRQQAESYSLATACALLTAGHGPPPCLLQSPADADTDGNTDPKSADHVQNELSEINHQVKENTLEVPQSETLEGPSFIANPLLENDSPDSSKPDFLEGHDIVSRLLPENNAIDTVENDSIEVSQVWGQTDSDEGTSSMPTTPLYNDTSYCLAKEASHNSETRPFCLVSPNIEKDLLHITEQNGKLGTSSLFLDKCDNDTFRILEQQSSINDSDLQLYHMDDTTEVHDVCVSNDIAICARPEALSSDSPERVRVSHTLERNSVMSLDKSVPMPECPSFNFPVPSDSTNIAERAFQGFCESKNLINFSSSLSVKYNMKPLDCVYQSLPSRFETLMNRLRTNSVDTNLLDPSYDSKEYILDLDGAFMMPNDQTSASSNVFSVQEDSDAVLTPSFEKFDPEKLPGTTGCRLDYLGYGTNIYQSKGTSSLDLTAGKSYTRKTDQHVHIRANQDIKNPKEVGAPLPKQNQQPPKSCAKRDVRVRALKVAAAAKRREEKKQTEREMRKAALKLGLERLKEEKEQRQNNVEHKKKTEAEFITRKRQKNGDGKSGNDRKNKCYEELLEHQKELEDLMHSTNTVKEACPMKEKLSKILVCNLSLDPEIFLLSVLSFYLTVPDDKIKSLAVLPLGNMIFCTVTRTIGGV